MSTSLSCPKNRCRFDSAKAESAHTRNGAALTLRVGCPSDVYDTNGVLRNAPSTISPCQTQRRSMALAAVCVLLFASNAGQISSYHSYSYNYGSGYGSYSNYGSSSWQLWQLRLLVA